MNIFLSRSFDIFYDFAFCKVVFEVIQSSIAQVNVMLFEDHI